MTGKTKPQPPSPRLNALTLVAGTVVALMASSCMRQTVPSEPLVIRYLSLHIMQPHGGSVHCGWDSNGSAYCELLDPKFQIVLAGWMPATASRIKNDRLIVQAATSSLKRFFPSLTPSSASRTPIHIPRISAVQWTVGKAKYLGVGLLKENIIYVATIIPLVSSAGDEEGLHLLLNQISLTRDGGRQQFRRIDLLGCLEADLMYGWNYKLASESEVQIAAFPFRYDVVVQKSKGLGHANKTINFFKYSLIQHKMKVKTGEIVLNSGRFCYLETNSTHKLFFGNKVVIGVLVTGKGNLLFTGDSNRNVASDPNLLRFLGSLNLTGGSAHRNNM